MILGEHSTCPVEIIACINYGCNVITGFVEHVVINCSKIHFVLSPDADVDLIYNLIPLWFHAGRWWGWGQVFVPASYVIEVGVRILPDPPNVVCKSGVISSYLLQLFLYQIQLCSIFWFHTWNIWGLSVQDFITTFKYCSIRNRINKL